MHRVCVFAASNPGHLSAHAEAARALGAEIGRRGWGMVFGGTDQGLMRLCANAALAAGAEVTGVVPRFFAGGELPHRGLTELRLVKTLHERKAVMSALSDAVVALPGGAGTLDELFDAFTSRLAGQHQQPIGLLDSAGYYQPLLRFLEQARDQGFLAAPALAGLVVEAEASTLLDRLGPRPAAESR
jgi:uncharacterized protein (TIGR00730 family)